MPEKDSEDQLDDLPSSAGDDAKADTTAHTAESSQTEERPSGTPEKVSRQVTLPLRSVISATVITCLAVMAAVFGWLYLGARHDLDAQAQEAAARERAQQIATDYAVNAAEMDYQDFNAWTARLVDGTSPELKEKLTKAAGSMEQLLTPMQWKSTARPLSSIVKSNSDGVYTVDAFVSVLTKTMQAPEGLQSTATYSVTIDSRNNWLITDVGGIDAALGRNGGDK